MRPNNKVTVKDCKFMVKALITFFKSGLNVMISNSKKEKKSLLTLRPNIENRTKQRENRKYVSVNTLKTNFGFPILTSASSSSCLFFLISLICTAVSLSPVSLSTSWIFSKIYSSLSLSSWAFLNFSSSSNTIKFFSSGYCKMSQNTKEST